MLYKSSEYNREYSKKYYHLHKGSKKRIITEERKKYLKEYNKRWVTNNKERRHNISKRSYLKRKNDSLTIFKRYKNRAKKYNYSFNLSLEIFTKLITTECVYCGEKDFPFNGIDRTNNMIGYEVENSSPCCCMCNTMKLTYSVEEFIRKCKKIANKY